MGTHGSTLLPHELEGRCDWSVRTEAASPVTSVSFPVSCLAFFLALTGPVVACFGVSGAASGA